MFLVGPQKDGDILVHLCRRDKEWWIPCTVSFVTYCMFPIENIGFRMGTPHIFFNTPRVLKILNTFKI